MIRRKVSTVMTEKEYKAFSEGSEENIVKLKQQDNGSFVCESTHRFLPLSVINDILSQLHNIYQNEIFSDAFDKLPEAHKEYQMFLEKKCRVQKFWTIFWYAVALVAITYIIIGGR